ncbi:hypothetical protein EG68_01702 [Paragonimus skrjabini miyazakii]|uniref:Uncharacterized protein n=1 Tax=Paragonimus skrjabini miyazakii TaxID=59628 RepID=A0A8S9Z5G7_9TREM|nr:hypothetical protein EG68_01702 [Paragonimus skrjabini miyazakii]
MVNNTVPFLHSCPATDGALSKVLSQTKLQVVEIREGGRGILTVVPKELERCELTFNSAYLLTVCATGR